LPIIVFTLTSSLATTAVDSPQTTALVAFFDKTALSQLKFEDEESFFMQVDTLQWTTSGLSVAYWRACYSYILCSVIGGFEAAYKNWKEAKEQKHAVINGLTMALTGVQGTGKSVLGSFIALVMAKAFGWRVIYKWGDLTHTIGNPTPTDKIISILDFSSITTKRTLGSSCRRATVSAGNQRHNKSPGIRRATLSLLTLFQPQNLLKWEAGCEKKVLRR
jgi:hypothetical protein